MINEVSITQDNVVLNIFNIDFLHFTSKVMLNRLPKY